MQITRYYPGGFSSSAAQQNRADVFDGAAGTYTAWDQAGVQTVQRPLTSQEVANLAAMDASAAQAANQVTIQQQAQAALSANRGYLAISAPTTAQAVSQVAALTRQVQALIRLALNQFDATN